MNKQVNRKNIQVGNCEISYLESGPADAPVALFIHGIPANAELWREVIAGVGERGWHCLAPDLPGYGETELPKEADYSVLGAAQLLSEWLKQEDLNDIWLIGHDIGGGVAQLLITKDEPRFQKFTLSNCITADTWPVPEIKIMIALAKMRLFKLVAGMGVFSTFLGRLILYQSVVNKSALNSDTLSRIFWDSKVSTQQGRQKFQRLLISLDPQQTLENMKQLREVVVPVELVWGLKDPNQTWDGPGRILQEVFPSAKVITLPESGHFLQIDTPNQYIEALLESSDAPDA
jgi:2-hydroxymuconate-semialdehyde hydrolase